MTGMLLSSCFKSIIQTCAITPGLIWTKRVKPRMRYRMYLSISGTTGKRSVCRNPSGGIFFCHQTPGIEYFETSACRTNSFPFTVRILGRSVEIRLFRRRTDPVGTNSAYPSIFTPAMPYCVYEKLSGREKYLEIAEELRISVNTVKSHISKAYREIRGKIAVLKNSNLLLLIACATYKEMK